jgi:transcriptional regulator GlxA family with amidase domain
MDFRVIALFAFDGAQLLDVTGPASVFGMANTLGGDEAYKIVVVSPGGGLVKSSCGVVLQTLPVANIGRTKVHTLLVGGGTTEVMSRVASDPMTQKWIPKYARTAKRFGSICSGAFILASLGMLRKARVTTHWASCEALARFRDVSVDTNSLFVVDGKLWTSAGVSTGIDMALAMVERNIGRAMADRIAKFMILYSRRPGFQSQFSELLEIQATHGTGFGNLAVWIQERIARRLDVATLAAKAGLSERTFYRKFVKTTGQTPAKFIETLRLDAARSLLATSLPLKTIAARSGMGSEHRLMAAFRRRFGVSPSTFRRMHFGGDGINVGSASNLRRLSRRDKSA